MKDISLFTLLSLSCLINSCEFFSSDKVIISEKMLASIEEELRFSQQVIEFETEQLDGMLEEEIFERSMFGYDSVLIMIDDILVEYTKIEESRKRLLPLRKEYRISSTSVEEFQKIVLESKNVITKRLEDFLKHQEEKYGFRDGKIKQRLEYFSRLFEDLNDNSFYYNIILGTENEYWYYTQILSNKITRTKYELIMDCSTLIKWPCFYFSEYFPVVLSDKKIFKMGEEEKLEIGVGTYFTYIDKNSTELLINGKVTT